MKKEEDKKAKTPLNAAATSASVHVAHSTHERTSMYNDECTRFREVLGQKKQANQDLLNIKLSENPNYVGDRSKAVELAWKYERAETSMGGKGTGKWNSTQLEELRKHGKVRGAEGHHINSVAENPALQTNPDNIVLLQNRKEHLNKGHNGDFKNPSSGPLIDRDKRLASTNRKRVLKNEATGFAVAVGVGAATGVIDSVYAECKENGVSIKSVKNGFKKCGKPVLHSCVVAGGSYLISRALAFGFHCLTK